MPHDCGGVVILTGEEAVDVSRMTGIPWSWERVASWEPLVPVLDLLRLSYADRMRVAWARIGAWFYLDGALSAP